MNSRYPSGTAASRSTCASTYSPPAWGRATTFPPSCGYGSTGNLLPPRVCRNMMSSPHSLHLIVLAITGHPLVISDPDLFGEFVGVPGPLELADHGPRLRPGEV